MSTLKGRPAIIINVSLRLLIKEQRNINHHFKTLSSLKKTIEAWEKKAHKYITFVDVCFYYFDK